MKNIFIFAFCFLLQNFQFIFSQQVKISIRFLPTDFEKEFIAEISVSPVQNAYLDLQNSYLSLVNNEADSMDQGLYKIVYFNARDSLLLAKFQIDEYTPNKFTRVHLVFRDSLGNSLFTQSQYFKLVLPEDIRICYEGNNLRVYFRQSAVQVGCIYNLLGQKILDLKQIFSGESLPVANFATGLYILQIENIGTKKFFKK